ncbi:hypothetical protein [Runella salmonicolor]|uniref:Uncharacterized protein n=1 Tax=Runella salmonicolor TaxID=2950278 RepID=A0ABT1FHT9_9BACT|nr:hypothetical protein [Runella salmonicolor]MCP1381311.1 hypothetical protein [Runella salmonicolor]
MKLQAPLSNLQMELLKLYSAGVSDEHLNEIKVLIAKYLFEKARERADAIWDNKNYSDEKINELLKPNT